MDPFVAEIRIFPFNFAPKGWAFCDGQLLPLSQNTALFSLLGTTYGGDGKSNFALPNLQGCVPLHAGQGPGLSLRDLGESAGSASVTLLNSELPSHSHTPTRSLGSTAVAHFESPSSSLALSRSDGFLAYSAAALTPGLGTTVAGGSQPHNNVMPSLTLNFCIALQGVYPPRQ